MSLVYKICPRAVWQAAMTAGRYDGSDDDRRDGFIHLSTADQVPGTLADHFAGERDLVVVAYAADDLGAALRFEPSRGGALFPHQYGPLPTAKALWVRAIGDDTGSGHILPALA